MALPLLAELNRRRVFRALILYGVVAFAVLQIAEVYAVRKDKDRAFEWLQRGYEQHDGGLGMLKWDRFMGTLRDDPRYEAMLRKINLPVD